MSSERIPGWARAHGDLAVGVGAAILFVVAWTLAPEAGCGPVTASGAFNAAAWASGLGFLLAGVLALCFRASPVSKAVLFLLSLVAALVAVLALLSAASPNGFGFQDSERGTPTMQVALRRLANGADESQHAYWLGQNFRGATVTFASGSWGDYALLRYTKTGGSKTVLDFDVLAYTWGEDNRHRAAFPTALRVRTTTDQDVVVFFRTPERPDAALIRETRAAVQVIPAAVTYEGCAS